MGKMNRRVRGCFLSLEGNQKHLVGKVKRKKKKKTKGKSKEGKEKKEKKKKEGECVRDKG